MTPYVSSDYRRAARGIRVVGVCRPTTSLLLVILLTVFAACTTPPPSVRPTTGVWAHANYDYANTRDAVDSTISSQNVHKLGVAWTFQVQGVSLYGSLSTSPIVVNGIVYLQDLQSNVYAIDLKTGNLKWEKLYNATSVGPDGVAVDQGMVFVASSMETVAALNATTGAQVWSRQVPHPNLEGIDQQLTAYQGTLYVSTIPGTDTGALSSLTFYQGGEMGTIYALDEHTGSIKWSFNTVKDGNLWGNSKVNSGGGAWYPPAIDTSTDTTYWGIGNAGPYPGTAQYPNGSSRPGPNLYTDSELALTDSGQVRK